MALSSLPFPNFTRSVVALALIGVAAPMASADNVGPYTVRAGVPTVVLSYASYESDNCMYTALPRLTILVPPAHGTATVGKASHVAKDGPCAGTSLKSSAVQYRANPGYHGTDTIAVGVEMDEFVYKAGSRGDRVDIAIIVK